MKKWHSWKVDDCNADAVKRGTGRKYAIWQIGDRHYQVEREFQTSKGLPAFETITLKGPREGWVNVAEWIVEYSSRWGMTLSDAYYGRWKHDNERRNTP